MMDAGTRVRYTLLKATTWTMRLLTLATIVVVVLAVASVL